MRNIYLNGAAGTSSGTNFSVAPTRFHMGGYWNGAVYTPVGNNILADVAVWNAALTQAEISALARGLSPLRIRPGNLVALWPLASNAGYLNNIVANATAKTLTLSGTAPAIAADPPVQPWWPSIGGWRGGGLPTTMLVAVDLAVLAPPTLDAATLDQKHNLSATGFTVAPPSLSAAGVVNVLLPIGKTVGAPTFSGPVFTTAVGTSSLATAPPTIGVGTFKQKHVFATASFAVSSPTLQAPVSHQSGDAIANDLATPPPVLAVAVLGQKQVLVASGLATGVPEFDFALIAQAIVPVSLATSAPVITPSALTRTFVVHADDLIVGHPSFFEPEAEETGPPTVWFPCRDERWSHDPDAKWFDEDHDQGEKPVKQAIFTNLNDELDLSVSHLTLVGRTSPERGRAEAIEPVLPLYLSARKLWVDWTDVDNLRTDLTTETAARAAAVTAEAAARVAADAAEASARATITDGVPLVPDYPGSPYPSGGSLTTVGGVWTFTEDTANAQHNIGFYLPDANGAGQLPPGAHYIEFEVKQSAGATRYFQWYTTETTNWTQGITCFAYFDGTHPSTNQWSVSSGEYWLDAFVIEPSTDGYYKHRLWYRTTILRPVAVYLFLDNVWGGAATYVGNGASALSVRNFAWKRLFAPPPDLAGAIGRQARGTKTAYAYADLPSNPEIGTQVQITNANVATFRAAVTGTGANVVLAWWNGTSWLVFG